MGKKHKHLFDRIIDRDNLWRAYQKASRGKRQSLGYLQFRQNEAANIERLGQLLAAGDYRPSEPRRFMVFEPKAREISALPFVDREMRLRFSRWSVQPAAAGVNFRGYRIWPTHKLLRRSSVQSAKRRLDEFDATGDAEGRQRFLGAWLGHARHANTHNLLTALGVQP